MSTYSSLSINLCLLSEKRIDFLYLNFVVDGQQNGRMWALHCDSFELFSKSPLLHGTTNLMSQKTRLFSCYLPTHLTFSSQLGLIVAKRFLLPETVLDSEFWL